jgi:hypothetical protein
MYASMQRVELGLHFKKILVRDEVLFKFEEQMLLSYGYIRGDHIIVPRGNLT